MHDSHGQHTLVALVPFVSGSESNQPASDKRIVQ